MRKIARQKARNQAGDGACVEEIWGVVEELKNSMMPPGRAGVLCWDWMGRGGRRSWREARCHPRGDQSLRLQATHLPSSPSTRLTRCRCLALSPGPRWKCYVLCLSCVQARRENTSASRSRSPHNALCQTRPTQGERNTGLPRGPLPARLSPGTWIETSCAGTDHGETFYDSGGGDAKVQSAASSDVH